MNPRSVALAALVLVSACQSSRPEAPPPVTLPPTPVSSASAGPPASSASSPPVASDAELRVSNMLAVMAKLRSLEATGSVRGLVIDRTTMIEQLKKRVREEIPPEALRGQGEFLRAFGLIPKNYDFEKGLYDLVQSQLAGYYEPETKSMYLMDDLPPREAEATLAHELVHALQDQHYDLGPRMKYKPDSNDSQSALQCLAEGDATSAMYDYLLVSEERVATDIPDMLLEVQVSAAMALSPDLAKFPSVLRSSLIAPYVDGVLFIHALRRQGGWAAVDAVWQNPPTTTEQILHLDKFDIRERAETVPVPTAGTLGSDWKTTYFDVYGEQGLRVALEGWLPKPLAAKAAKGWSGDHAMVAERHTSQGVDVAAAWRVRFDPSAGTQGKSGEALEAYRSIALAWNLPVKSATLCRLLPDGTPVAVLTRDRDVVLVGGAGLGKGRAASAACAAAINWGSKIISSS